MAVAATYFWVQLTLKLKFKFQLLKKLKRALAIDFSVLKLIESKWLALRLGLHASTRFSVGVHSIVSEIVKAVMEPVTYFLLESLLMAVESIADETFIENRFKFAERWNWPPTNSKKKWQMPIFIGRPTCKFHVKMADANEWNRPLLPRRWCTFD